MATDSAATAQANGLAMNVGPCMSAFGAMPDAIFSVARVAASVMNPPVMALPTHMMSGTTPLPKVVNRSPERPKPVAISSAMSGMPEASQSWRSPCTSSGSWKRMPPAPWTTGSMMTPAMSAVISEANCSR